MDLLLFQKILDRRTQLQKELSEIDSFLRQAEMLASRLARVATDHTHSNSPGVDLKVTREPSGFQTADGRRWPQADIGSIPRDFVSR